MDRFSLALLGNTDKRTELSSRPPSWPRLAITNCSSVSLESDPLPGASPLRPSSLPGEGPVHRMRHGNEGESRGIAVERGARLTWFALALECKRRLGDVRAV